MSAEEPETAVKTELSFLKRAVSASPLGIAAVVGGVVLTLSFLVVFEQMIGDVESSDLAVAIRALEITVVSVWIVMALWGWYLIRDGLDRVETKKRIKEQAELLSRIHDVVEERDATKAKKQELDRKARTFWTWRRESN
jgi:protein-S-isoprenylcysteine O-methyltransferase Ste14